MTEHRILTLAWLEALDLWKMHKEKAEAFPGDEMLKALENGAWAEVEELHRMVLEIERRDKK